MNDSQKTNLLLYLIRRTFGSKHFRSFQGDVCRLFSFPFKIRLCGFPFRQYPRKNHDGPSVYLSGEHWGSSTPLRSSNECKEVILSKFSRLFEVSVTTPVDELFSTVTTIHFIGRQFKLCGIQFWKNLCKNVLFKCDVEQNKYLPIQTINAMTISKFKSRSTSSLMLHLNFSLPIELLWDLKRIQYVLFCIWLLNVFLMY